MQQTRESITGFWKNTKYAFQPCLIPKWLYIFSMFLSLWAVFICCILTSCILCMLRESDTRFSASSFFHESISPGPLPLRHGGNWFMKKKRSSKSRVRLPLTVADVSKRNLKNMVFCNRAAVSSKQIYHPARSKNKSCDKLTDKSIQNSLKFTTESVLFNKTDNNVGFYDFYFFILWSHLWAGRGS
jgi:hypothetical protein